MTDLVKITSSKQGKRAPAILGLPGFISSIEKGRIEDLLRQIGKEGFVTYKMTYSDTFVEKKEKGDVITCVYSRENYANDLRESLRAMVKDPEVDSSNLGLVAISISGATLLHSIADGLEYPITSTGLIVPLPGWNYFGSEEERKQLAMLREANKAHPDDEKYQYVDIRTMNDIRNNIMRRIPTYCLDELMKIDGLKALESYNPKKNLMNVMTIGGMKDKTSSPKSMMKCHELLGGDPENLIMYENEEHSIPVDKLAGLLVPFFVRTMLKEKAA